MRKRIAIRGFVAALVFCCISATALHAQALLDEKLHADLVGGIEPGSYDAGENISFTLDPYGDDYLLHLTGDREVFVLHPDHASLGGRLLKYDSGTTALQVSGWGAITLYTDSEPAGLPAVRDGDSAPPSLEPISLDDAHMAAQDESLHLAYSDRINVSFSVDWNALANNPNARALVFDAIQNVTRGLERLAQGDAAKSALAQKISSVRLTFGKGDNIRLWGKTLVVCVDPGKGYAGRASSRAVAQSLSRLLSIHQAANDWRYTSAIVIRSG